MSLSASCQNYAFATHILYGPNIITKIFVHSDKVIPRQPRTYMFTAFISPRSGDITKSIQSIIATEENASGVIDLYLPKSQPDRYIATYFVATNQIAYDSAVFDYVDVKAIEESIPHPLYSYMTNRL